MTRRAAGLALLLPALAGCERPGVDVSGSLRFDGVYAGTVSGESGGASCRTGGHAVRLRIADGRISFLGHRAHYPLEGSVGSDGHVDMQEDTGRSRVFGTIYGERLEASETTARSGSDGSAVPCVAALVADRVAGTGPASP